MIKLGELEFDDRILDALRDDTLVVFAGAGVSMGAPSNLVSFPELVEGIARGSNIQLEPPLDRYLGRLHHRKIPVHDRAARLLTPPGSEPNALHHDLLRLFRTPDRVKLITTNFDLHFESAAKNIFGIDLNKYSAPALPLGYDFDGIVHVHGALPNSRRLVLTDADFGRAYLTEGWARRFLVDVFRRYTVLFIGYSHNDVAMNYLARALPAEELAGRFAITDEDGNWEILGITPISFARNSEGEPFKHLYDGVRKLADLASREALEWQSKIAEICSRPPPTDEEASGQVERALREVHTTRFFTKVARDPEWPRWLNARKFLVNQFGPEQLSDQERHLTWWLAEHFCIEYPEVMLELIVLNGFKVGPELWWAICRELGVMKEKKLNDVALRRWIAILLSNIPPNADHHALMWLAERAALQEMHDMTLKAFLCMSAHKVIVKPGYSWLTDTAKPIEQRLDIRSNCRADHWSLNEIWSKYLLPNMSSIGLPLVSDVVRQLEDMYSGLEPWGKVLKDWDPISYGRSAIEPHEQDRFPEAVDVLIDAVRDGLEWLDSQNSGRIDVWVNNLCTSDVPLLRRLAIHAMAERINSSADERLVWLIENANLHAFSEHHEVHRVAALNYAGASPAVRKVLIDRLVSFSLPSSEEWSGEMRTARSHFDWLSWLLKAKPDCELIGAYLDPIKKRYPEWRLSDHPDLTHWTGSGEWVGSESPWSVERLLESSPDEQLEEFLEIKVDRYGRSHRDGLIEAVKEACKQKRQWGFALANCLIERGNWTLDLWPAVFRGLQESEMPVSSWKDLLEIASHKQLLATIPYDIAILLRTIVQNGGKEFALEILDQANAVAATLWAETESGDAEDRSDWLSRAINKPAGIVAEFWIEGLGLLTRGKKGRSRRLPESYREWFQAILQDAGQKGGLGRSVLASQVAFLGGLDKSWTLKNIVPLFSDPDPRKFHQAWDGFLVWGRISTTLVDALVPAFIGAHTRLKDGKSERRRRFVELYTILAVFHVADPTTKLLPSFFDQSTSDDRAGFASHLGYLLRQLEPAARMRLWNSWLRKYWQERLQAVPSELDENEIRQMWGWLPRLDDCFSEAMALAVQAPHVSVEHSHVLFELQDSQLIESHPSDLAKFLIYLCQNEIGHQAKYVGDVAKKLKNLTPELKRQLDESLARAGVNL